MASYAGVLDYTNLIDSTQSMTAPRLGYGGYVMGTNLHAGWSAGSPGSPAAGGNSLSFVEANWLTVGYDWFNKVHLTPRSKIEFGNIISSLTTEYELFSAWKTDVTFTAVDNAAGDGVSLPSLPTPPETLYSFSSFLDPASTRLNKTKLRVQATEDGPPTFDSYIEFTFSTGETPILELSGNRIALLTPRYESTFQERWSFLTDVIQMVSGKEQRIALRSKPRMDLFATYLLDEEDRQRMQAILFGWQSKLFAVPLWHEELRSTSAASLSDTVLQVNTTTNIDFRVGGLAVVYESPTKYDVVVLSAVGTNTLEFDDTPLLNSYGSNATVAPVRLAYIASSVRGGRYKTKLERFDIQFTVFDNDTGMYSGDTSGWNSHDGKVLLDDLNVMGSEQIAQEFRQKILKLDNDTGKISTASRWSKHKHASQKGFVARNRSEIIKLKKLFMALNGKQKSFYMPTLINDLTPVADLEVGLATMNITNVGYTRFVVGGANATPKNLIRIVFTDGTSLTRTITSATEVSNSVEQLVLDDTWPADRTVSEIERVEFLELTRFDSDVFTFRFPKTNSAVVLAPTVTVFD